MNVIQQIRFLIDKQNGFGLPYQVLGRYFGCHPSGIKRYVDGDPVPEQTRIKYETGIARLIEDFKKNVEG